MSVALLEVEKNGRNKYVTRATSHVGICQSWKCHLHILKHFWFWLNLAIWIKGAFPPIPANNIGKYWVLTEIISPMCAAMLSHKLLDFTQHVGNRQSRKMLFSQSKTFLISTKLGNLNPMYFSFNSCEYQCHHTSWILHSDTIRNSAITEMTISLPKTFPISTRLESMNPRYLCFNSSEYLEKILRISWESLGISVLQCHHTSWILQWHVGIRRLQKWHFQYLTLFWFRPTSGVCI